MQVASQGRRSDHVPGRIRRWDHDFEGSSGRRSVGSPLPYGAARPGAPSIPLDTRETEANDRSDLRPGGSRLGGRLLSRVRLVCPSAGPLDTGLGALRCHPRTDGAGPSPVLASRALRRLSSAGARLDDDVRVVWRERDRAARRSLARGRPTTTGPGIGHHDEVDVVRRDVDLRSADGSTHDRPRTRQRPGRDARCIAPVHQPGRHGGW